MIFELNPILIINILQKWSHNASIGEMNKTHILDKSWQMSDSSVLLSFILHIFNVKESILVGPWKTPNSGDQHHCVRSYILIPTSIVPIHGWNMLATQINHQVSCNINVLFGSWCHHHNEISYITHQISVNCIPSIHVSLQQDSYNNVKHVSGKGALGTHVPVHEKANWYLQPHAKHHTCGKLCFSRCVWNCDH